ncbi:hypothetical protein [Neobacillus sp.]|uniref:hypothetical protein n=1 Tax=Neobacillus sp. TaxID=2675273 RepID=UPI0028A1A102|nr:hypothetical protein [Neobacillus sp.]
MSITIAVEKLCFSTNYASVFALRGSPIGEFSLSFIYAKLFFNDKPKDGFFYEETGASEEKR